VPQQDQTVVVGVLLVLIAALNEAWAARSER
jgi:hypothetical protein